MYWLRWHYHVKDIARAPYKIKKKERKEKKRKKTVKDSVGHKSVAEKIEKYRQRHQQQQQ